MQLCDALKRMHSWVPVEIYRVDQGGQASLCATGTAGEVRTWPSVKSEEAVALMRIPGEDGVQVYIM